MKKACKGIDDTKVVAKSLDWSSIKKQKHYIGNVINTLDTKYHSMSAVGAKMTGTESVMEYISSDPVTIKPLGSIMVYKDSALSNAVTEENIAVGKTLSFSNYTYKAFFNDGSTEYSDFDKKRGYWILTDENGNEIESSDVADLIIDGGHNQRLKTKTEGTVYVKYVINEEGDDRYYYYLNGNSNNKNYVNNSDLTNALFIEINVHNSEVAATVASMFSADNTGKTVTAFVV